MKNSTKFILIILSAIIVSVTVVYFFIGRDKEMTKKRTAIKIGVLLYRSDDTFISTIRKAIEDYAKEYEKENNVKINLEVVDAENSQNIQNKQVERLLSLNYDVLCINPVERANVSNIIDKALEKQVPIIFFNRQPVEDDIRRSDLFYYIGVDPKKSAVIQGEILNNEYRKDKRSLDINGDGEVSYVLLEGEKSHQDSIIRTEWAIKTVEDAGVPIKKLTGGIANWERSQASAIMEEWLNEFGNEIELVISNNDDMALGTIDAIERANKGKAIKIVGIDGTLEAIKSVEEGKLLGTVSSNKEDYAKKIIDLAIKAVASKENAEERQREKYYDVSQRAIIK